MNMNTGMALGRTLLQRLEEGEATSNPRNLRSRAVVAFMPSCQITQRRAL